MLIEPDTRWPTPTLKDIRSNMYLHHSSQPSVLSIPALEFLKKYLNTYLIPYQPGHPSKRTFRVPTSNVFQLYIEVQHALNLSTSHVLPLSLHRPWSQTSCISKYSTLSLSLRHTFPLPSPSLHGLWPQTSSTLELG